MFGYVAVGAALESNRREAARLAAEKAKKDKELQTKKEQETLKSATPEISSQEREVPKVVEKSPEEKAMEVTQLKIDNAVRSHESLSKQLKEIETRGQVLNKRDRSGLEAERSAIAAELAMLENVTKQGESQNEQWRKDFWFEEKPSVVEGSGRVVEMQKKLDALNAQLAADDERREHPLTEADRLIMKELKKQMTTVSNGIDRLNKEKDALWRENRQKLRDRLHG